MAGGALIRGIFFIIVRPFLRLGMIAFRIFLRNLSTVLSSSLGFSRVITSWVTVAVAVWRLVSLTSGWSAVMDVTASQFALLTSNPAMRINHDKKVFMIDDFFLVEEKNTGARIKTMDRESDGTKVRWDDQWSFLICVTRGLVGFYPMPGMNLLMRAMGCK